MSQGEWGSGEIWSLILINISTNNISDNRKIVTNDLQYSPGCLHQLEKFKYPQLR